MTPWFVLKTSKIQNLAGFFMSANHGAELTAGPTSCCRMSGSLARMPRSTQEHCPGFKFRPRGPAERFAFVKNRPRILNVCCAFPACARVFISPPPRQISGKLCCALPSRTDTATSPIESQRIEATRFIGNHLRSLRDVSRKVGQRLAVRKDGRGSQIFGTPLAQE